MSSYVTDLQHFLDEEGEIVADIPTEARQLASFFALIVDDASCFAESKADEVNVRCRSEGCPSQILAHREPADEIVWHCPTCDQNGVIRNWSGTKWDRRRTA